MTKVFVIGAGYWGRNLIRNFQELGALAGICDNDNAELVTYRETYPGVPTCTDIDEALADSAAAVAVATPASTHGDVVERALSVGKHVFVEKPLCLDLNQGFELKRQSEEQDRTLMVGHLLLYHPAFRALKSYIAEGRIGQLRYIYSNRASLGKIRQEENALWSFAPHDISMILNLTETMPARLVSNGGTYLSPSVADTSLTHMTFAEGLQAHIFVSWLHPYKDHRMVVIGSDGMAEFNDAASKEKKLLAYDHKIGWEGSIPTVNRAEGKPIPYTDEEPLRIECAHFLDCILSGERPISNVDEGIRVLTVLDACQRSLTNGIPVEF